MRRLLHRLRSGRSPGSAVATSDPPLVKVPEKVLEALTPRAQPGGAYVRYRNEFEGFWTDRTDADAVLARRMRAGFLTDEDRMLLEHWIEHGFVILPGAVPAAVCEAVKDDLQRAFTDGDARLRILAPGEHFGRPLGPGEDMRAMRVNDIYVYFESARRALFSEPIRRFLVTIFDSDPLLIQSLTFDLGSEQGYHRDSAYVVVDPPMALAAAWIALEDVRPGSGELTYIVGSHRIAAPLFADAYKCWNPGRDGPEAHDHFTAELLAACDAAGLERRTLRVRRGDVLIWSADLVHGGLPIVDPSLTRRSLVGHYCPTWAVPRYFDEFPERRGRKVYDGGWYASMHYAVDAT